MARAGDVRLSKVHHDIGHTFSWDVLLEVFPVIFQHDDGTAMDSERVFFFLLLLFLILFLLWFWFLCLFFF